jgi:hypothetical protein
MHRFHYKASFPSPMKTVVILLGLRFAYDISMALSDINFYPQRLGIAVGTQDESTRIWLALEAIKALLLLSLLSLLFKKSKTIRITGKEVYIPIEHTTNNGLMKKNREEAYHFKYTHIKDIITKENTVEIFLKNDSVIKVERSFFLMHLLLRSFQNCF